MCGICGGIGPKAPSLELISKQLDSIAHRGPDDSGTYLAQGISLGMCRLAIVEISDGDQPAKDKDKQVYLVFNGEIYNYRQLREELSTLGVRFQNSSESEVIIQGYLTYGIEFIKKLNGMFALAIFDSRTQELFLVRDRLGKKPLWITSFSDGSLNFGSEVRALMLARPDRTLRTEMISEVMTFGFINAPNSAFNEIYQIPPGSYLHWKSGRHQINRYWAPSFESKTNMAYAEALQHTKELLEAAVKRRLISERPLGSFLSGGYDSTIVTAYMSKLMPQKVQTYSIGFKSQKFNEAPHAERIAEHLGTIHHTEILDPDPTLIVEEIAQVLDQPFADSSIVPTYLLSKFARKDLVVALSGDGGDEVFGGYDRYLAAPILQKLNPALGMVRRGLSFTGNIQLGGNRRLRRISTQLAPMESLGHRYLSIQSLAQSHNLRSLLNPELVSDRPTNEFLANFDENPRLSTLDRLVHSDLSFYLPGDILSKIDIASMANGLELRSPMLDWEVVEWGLSLPTRFRVNLLETKHILKDVARSLVPATLVDRPKMGFGIPRAEWLRTDMKDMAFDLLVDQTSVARNWFDVGEVRGVMNRHMNGEDLDHLIWPMLMIELWARTWFD
jgi:asparagine synthase (glutamine-hydrolysing)